MALTPDPLLLLPSVLMKDRCKLFCRVAGSTAYYQLRDRVIDGTPCGPDTNDICVQGLCRVSVFLLTLLSCELLIFQEVFLFLANTLVSESSLFVY